jgi:hypothetical protein
MRKRTKIASAVLFLVIVSVTYLVVQKLAVGDKCEEVSLAGGCALYGVSMVELLADSEKYDGKRVRVVGYIHFEFEGNAIYLHKEDEANHLYLNGLWVSLEDGISSANCQDTYALIEGTFEANKHGHMGLWSGMVSQVTRCVKWQ